MTSWFEERFGVIESLEEKWAVKRGGNEEGQWTEKWRENPREKDAEKIGWNQSVHLSFYDSTSLDALTCIFTRLYNSILIYLTLFMCIYHTCSYLVFLCITLRTSNCFYNSMALKLYNRYACIFACSFLCLGSRVYVVHRQGDAWEERWHEKFDGDQKTETWAEKKGSNAQVNATP